MACSEGTCEFGGFFGSGWVVLMWADLIVSRKLIYEYRIEACSRSYIILVNLVLKLCILVLEVHLVLMCSVGGVFEIGVFSSKLGKIGFKLIVLCNLGLQLDLCSMEELRKCSELLNN